MVLDLIKDYFVKRSQFVKIDDCLSESLAINFGVPQGIILGQLLFLIFINDIVKYLKNLMFKIFRI